MYSPPQDLDQAFKSWGLFSWLNIPYHLLADYTTKNIAKCYSNKIQSYQLSYEEGERLAV
ncbi:hypothetical protein F6I08_00740 [Aerococcus tenax]|nr:hypothetical protein F6I08_00740 [Aerococcus tenax]MDK8132493.1 hypothetical protein [Aerococcus urinae]